MRERTPCVYILASGFYGRLYVGVTSNLVGRVMQHRAGTFDGHTKRYGIKLLMWYDVTDRMEDAFASEKRMQKWPRDWKINLIERENREWNDLALSLGLPALPYNDEPRNRGSQQSTTLLGPHVRGDGAVTDW